LKVGAASYSIPTDRPEGDGTLTWDATGLTVVHVSAEGETGMGFTYAGPAAARTVESKLASVLDGADPMDVPAVHEAMVRAVRNDGRPGVCSCAISAVDVALWDLKARLLAQPLVSLLGRARDDVPVYGSGGFTTYDDDTTCAQLQHWADDLSIPRVKIKIGESWGSDVERDLHRTRLARRVIGDHAELYVDANGGYDRKQAVRVGRQLYEEAGVVWFEEPVSSDDHAGLREVRDSVAADVAAGEYGYSPSYFAALIADRTVDCVQIDVTRVGGITDWLAVAHLAAAHNLSVSGHCAPNLHAHVAIAVPNLRHVEYFHDHERIEDRYFEGALRPDQGRLVPDLGSPGHGLVFKAGDAESLRTN
jgi:L-alanine-DL-glutamate epimerase-like enolase superfamily enzyme